MIKGEIITLRAIEEGDLEIMRRWRNEPALRKMFREYREISPSMQEAWFKRIQDDRTQVNFAVNGKDGALIGYAGLSSISWVNRTAETGWYLGDARLRANRMGRLLYHALDTYRTLLDYAFDEMNLRRIYSEVYDHNRYTQMLHRRLGFTEEGRLRDHCYHNGWHDSFIYGLLKEERTWKNS
jgi:RimJ/RimL family protein N-acetyltransferase